MPDSDELWPPINADEPREAFDFIRVHQGPSAAEFALPEKCGAILSLYKQVSKEAKLKKPSTGLRMVPVEIIERKIYLIRSQRVMLDSGLAELYQVPTKALNQAVRRNLTRFPEDFMFCLTSQEAEEWNRSQSVTGPQKHRNPRLLPYA